MRQIVVCSINEQFSYLEVSRLYQLPRKQVSVAARLKMKVAVKILLVLQLFFGAGKWDALIVLSKKLNSKVRFISFNFGQYPCIVEIVGHVRD